MRSGNHARRAEPALQGMMLAERRLQWRESLVVREPFDGDHLGALRLYGKHEARAYGSPVDDDGAGAAHAMLAADMRASQPQMMAQAIGERQPRLDLDHDFLSVDFKSHGH